MGDLLFFFFFNTLQILFIMGMLHSDENKNKQTKTPKVLVEKKGLLAAGMVQWLGYHLRKEGQGTNLPETLRQGGP